MSGAVSFHAGLAAEDIVARHYLNRGHAELARRWRGKSGEIDLVLRRGADVIFVEVKKSRSFARAAERVSQTQMRRIMNAALEFLASRPDLGDPFLRFDVAAVNGIGAVHVIENAFGES